MSPALLNVSPYLLILECFMRLPGLFSNIFISRGAVARGPPMGQAARIRQQHHRLERIQIQQHPSLASWNRKLPSPVSHDQSSLCLYPGRIRIQIRIFPHQDPPHQATPACPVSRSPHTPLDRFYLLSLGPLSQHGHGHPQVSLANAQTSSIHV